VCNNLLIGDFSFCVHYINRHLINY
jgi:hypothetical protein